MNMTRYLTAHRGGEYYSGTQDSGDALGRVLAQSASKEDLPPGVTRGSDRYEDWAERSRRSALIARNFMLGYQDGLDFEGDTDLTEGEDPFGKERSALRTWGGKILSPHVEGITRSLSLPDGGADSDGLRDPQGEDGYEIKLDPDLRTGSSGRMVFSLTSPSRARKESRHLSKQ